MTPLWCNKKKLNEIYKSRRKNEEVDHIFPLKSKYGHGLHCPENLQLLPKNKNRKKYNKINMQKVFEIKNSLNTNIQKIFFYHADDEFLIKFKTFAKKNKIDTKVEYINILRIKQKNIYVSPTIRIKYKNKFFMIKYEGLM